MNIKKVATRVASKKLNKRVKSNRTLSLDHENYEELLSYCRGKGLKASNIVDELVKEYLKAVD